MKSLSSDVLADIFTYVLLAPIPRPKSSTARVAAPSTTSSSFFSSIYEYFVGTEDVIPPSSMLIHFRTRCRVLTRLSLVCQKFRHVVDQSKDGVLWKLACSLIATDAVPDRLFYGGTYKKVAQLLIEKQVEKDRCYFEQEQFAKEFRRHTASYVCGVFGGPRRPDARPESQYSPVLNETIRNRLVQTSIELLHFLRRLRVHVELSVDTEEFARTALLRYHLFLNLKRMYPNTWLIPTADIQYAWISHLLRTEMYSNFCQTFGVDPSHSLLLTESQAKLYEEALTQTAVLWYRTYGEPKIRKPKTLPEFHRPSSYFPQCGSAPSETKNALLSDLTTRQLLSDWDWLTQLEFFFNSPEGYLDVVRRLVSSYDRYLWLCKKYHGSCLAAPHVSVDLVFHAHQTDVMLYRRECDEYLGFQLNHSPKDFHRGETEEADENAPTEEIPLIKRLWLEEFHVSHEEDYKYAA